MIHYTCSQCGVKLESPDSLGGELDKCSECGFECPVPRPKSPKSRKMGRTMSPPEKHNDGIRWANLPRAVWNLAKAIWGLNGWAVLAVVLLAMFFYFFVGNLMRSFSR